MGNFWLGDVNCVLCFGFEKTNNTGTSQRMPLP